jgi:hypothetical protein
MMNHNHTDEATRIIGRDWKPDLLDFLRHEEYGSLKQPNAYILLESQKEIEEDARTGNF